MALSKRVTWRHVRRFHRYIGAGLKARPVKVSQPEPGSVLVLSPHIDDEVIGVGGALRQHVLQGDEVNVIYFSDCTEERMNEAKQVGEFMGFKKQVFFTEYTSKTLANDPTVVPRLLALIEQFNPKTVYLPSLLESHNAHLAVNHILMQCYQQKKYRFTIAAFEVWTTFLPNVLIDVSNVIEDKKSAIAMNVSQCAGNDWVEAAISLNRYRAVVSNRGRYAEGLMIRSAKDYHRIWKKLYA